MAGFPHQSEDPITAQWRFLFLLLPSEREFIDCVAALARPTALRRAQGAGPPRLENGLPPGAVRPESGLEHVKVMW